jgi:preprotein translocase subunit SecF
MTDLIDNGVEIDEDVVDDLLAHRRGPLGRLYHGETAIDFYGRRWWGLGFSAVMLLVSVGSLIGNGLNLSIEFRGGVEWEIPSPDMTEEDARAVLEANGLDGSDARVQFKTNRDTGLRTVSVEVGDQPDAIRQAVQDAFAEEVGVTSDDISTSSTSSTWGKSITEKALRALVIFFVLVAAFIAWRLEWRMAGAAIAAMGHDVLLSVGLYSLLGFHVTPATVVAFLTILGFSLYDTIVVFDKVQENQQRYVAARVPYGDIMNVSMNQVLMRSINTSLAAVLPVLSLLVLGAGILGATTLREFALALLVGLITGSYSSIFVASPLVAMAKEREPKFRGMRRQHVKGLALERLVLGGMPTGRRETRGRSAAPIAASPAPTAEAVLTHTPRPRKKKRRA